MTTVQTAWNTDAYIPPALRLQLLPVVRTSTENFRNGEIHAHVYHLVHCGIGLVKEMCHMLQRSDQVIYNALNELERAGYVTRTISHTGRGHHTTWSACQPAPEPATPKPQ